jgi:hypothetical protein
MKWLISALLLVGLAACSPSKDLYEPSPGRDLRLIEVVNRNWDPIRVEVYCGASMRDVILRVPSFQTVRKPVNLPACTSVWFGIFPLGGEAYRTHAIALSDLDGHIVLTIEQNPRQNSIIPVPQ